MNRYSDQIIGILEPKIGHAMAKSALKIQCKKLGVDPETIPSDKIGSLADSLYEPFKVFAGEDFANKMVGQLKQIK